MKVKNILIVVILFSMLISIGAVSATPTVSANPPGGVYNKSINVTLISDNDFENSIYFSSNETINLGNGNYIDPDYFYSYYGEDIPISKDTTLKFYADDEYGDESLVYAVVYKFNTPTDTKAPVVLKSTPTNNEKNVDLSKTIKVTFNEKVYYGNAKIYLKGVKSGRTIDAWITKGSADLWIDPYSKLAANAKYRIEIKAGSLTDLSGNPIAAKAIYFITRPYKYTSHVLTRYNKYYYDYDYDTGYYYVDSKYILVYFKDFINGERYGYPVNSEAISIYKASNVVLSKVIVYGYYYPSYTSGRVVDTKTYYSFSDWLRPPYREFFDKVRIYYKVRY